MLAAVASLASAPITNMNPLLFTLFFRTVPEPCAMIFSEVLGIGRRPRCHIWLSAFIGFTRPNAVLLSREVSIFVFMRPGRRDLAVSPTVLVCLIPRD
jgi:hypothetical protein